MQFSFFGFVVGRGTTFRPAAWIRSLLSSSQRNAHWSAGSRALRLEVRRVGGATTGLITSLWTWFCHLAEARARQLWCVVVPPGAALCAVLGAQWWGLDGYGRRALRYVLLVRSLGATGCRGLMAGRGVYSVAEICASGGPPLGGGSVVFGGGLALLVVGQVYWAWAGTFFAAVRRWRQLDYEALWWFAASGWPTALE